MADSITRTMVRGAYDLQKLRISVGNRIVGNFKAKLGQAPGESEAEALDDDAKRLLADLRASYERIADAIAAHPRAKFPGDALISVYAEFALVAQYIEMEAVEAQHFKRLGKTLESVPIYTEFLAGVRGIGPAMAGVIISEIDITKARYPSSLWKYAGLDVGPDGLGRSRRAEHLVQREYTNRAGEAAERRGITYNPWLKTKLMGVLAGSFLKSNSPYAEHYRNYRHRIETDPSRAIRETPGRSDDEWTKQRRHQAACRYMIKMFLIDLYNAWRPLEGLEVAPTYHEAKMGHVHRNAA